MRSDHVRLCAVLVHLAQLTLYFQQKGMEQNQDENQQPQDGNYTIECHFLLKQTIWLLTDTKNITAIFVVLKTNKCLLFLKVHFTVSKPNGRL
jgi:hypothetical protein